MGLGYRGVAPTGLQTLGGVRDYIQQSGLEEVLVDLVCLRVSQLHDCDFCLGLHSCDLAEKGVSAQKLAAVQAWRDAGAVFDQRERAALAWAETITRIAKKAMRGDAFDAVSTLFSEREIAGLTIAIGLINTYHGSPASS